MEHVGDDIAKFDHFLLAQTALRYPGGAVADAAGSHGVLVAWDGVAVDHDARHIQDFGFGTYIRNLVRALSGLGSPHRFILTCSRRDQQEFDGLADNFQLLPYERTDADPFDQLAFPAFARGVRADLIHVPLNVVPIFLPRPYVVTVHDLSWERVPDAFPPNFRRYARLFARRSARTATRVIAISESTARDLRELYGVPDAAIRVVPNGIEPDLRPPVPREPIILSVGILEGRKRIPVLADGHARYWRDAPADPPPCRLVIVGGDGGDEAAVRAVAGPGCEIRGFIERDELLELYRRATVLVYPSAYEGFGIPVAEAMPRMPRHLRTALIAEEIAGDTATSSKGTR